MAVQAISVARLQGMSAIPIEVGPEKASQTFLEGAVLIADLANQVIQQAADEPVANILGIAVGDASGVTNTDVDYIPADLFNIVFEANIGTSVSAGAIAATDLFEEYPLRLSGTSWFIDKTDQLQPSVRIIGFKDAVGTVNGRVYFKFIQSAVFLAT